MTRNALFPTFIAILAGTLAACSTYAGDDPSETTGEVNLAIQSIPSDTQCIRITAAATSRSVQKFIDVTPGSSVDAIVDGLPVGVVSFTGDAFGARCSEVTRDSISAWTAESVVANVTNSTSADVMLVFRKNGRARIAADFESGLTWLERTPMPVPVGAFSYVNYDGAVFILGGGLADSGASNTVQRYDTQTDAWDVDTNRGGTLSPMPAAREFGLNSGVLGNRIHAVGGWDESGSYRGDHFIYDPANNTWSIGPSIPSYPIGQFSAVVGDAMYVMGGWWGTYQNTVYRYTDATGWTQVAPMPTPRNHATTAVVDGKIYAIGGEGGQYAQAELDVVEAYDPATNSWTTGLAPLPTARTFLGWSGTPVVGSNVYLIANYVYSPSANQWVGLVPPMPDGMAAAIQWQNVIYSFSTSRTVAGIWQ